MKKILILLAILLFVFVNDASAYPGVSLKGNGLSIGNIRGEGSVIDGLSLTFGSSESEWFDEINGISLSFVPASRQINGLYLSPFLLTEVKHKIKGIAVNPFLIASRSEVTGISIGGFVFSNTVNGFAISVISLMSEVNGLVISFGNIIGEINGVSISILGNTRPIPMILDALLPLEPKVDVMTEKVNGIQIGLFNSTKELHGIQIGLLNYAGNNPFLLRIIPGINIHF